MWVLATAGMVIGNFLWQSISSHNWEVATEISFFQIAAVIIIYITKPWE